ncbi:unnamed protein product [Adineta steineri]|uniref:Uncharacterized protein n=1 Tax=Adineta steineri TaxID=433720 RepID=A0A814G541_9BILA|nr:unnamed protein product [Adineta steineri]CAF3709287.1 unnamed protein product [Adineta steineri]
MEQYKWMYFKPYGSTVNLEPLFNNTQCIRESECYWLLPDKHTRVNYPVNKTLTAKYSIASNGILTIVDIQANDNGIYHFFKMNNSNWIVSKALLNLHGAPFDSVWLEYWPNVVGGLVAMAAVLITFGLILLANKYRYRPPSTLSTRRTSDRPRATGSIISSRANPIFLNDDNNTITSQPRTNSRRSSSTSNATNLRVEQF